MALTREQALGLLQKYNHEAFHLQHALTVEGVMRWFAQEQGEDPEFWGLCETHLPKWFMPSAPTATVCAAMWSRNIRWRRFSSPWTNSPV